MSNLFIKCMFHNKNYNIKPSKNEIGYIQKNIKETTIAINDLANELCHGATFKPGVLVGGMTADCWKEQQLFGLDFDDGMTIEEAYNIAKNNNIIPVFMYTTFSHTENHHKFRMVFCNDSIVTDIKTRDKLQISLMNIFKKTDAKCKNRDRLFFGGKGKEVIYPSYDSRINADEIINKFYPKEIIVKKSTKYRRNKEKKTSNIKKDKRTDLVVNYIPNENIIPFSSYPVKCVAKGNLKCLRKYFKDTIWIEGCHRERFIFIYYNCLKTLYGTESAFKECIEINNKMEEPLTQYELKSAIKHIDEHIEDKGLYIHGDGVFVFKPETIISKNWLDIPEEKARDYGFFDNKIKKEEAEINKNINTLRDKEIAKLYLSGEGYKNIAKHLPEELKCSASTVKRTIERLGIKDRTIKFEKINFNENRKYVRVPKLTKLEKENFFRVKSSENIFIDKECEKLYEINQKYKEKVDKNEQEKVIEALQNKEINYILYGNAGSGKSYCISTFLSKLSNQEKKRTIVLTPTGISSTNINYINAKTIHSYFHLKKEVYKNDNSSIILHDLKNIDRIIMDEIGMVRKDIFTEIIYIIQTIERLYNKKIQLILVGDYGQISPVVTKEDKIILDKYYPETIGKYYAFNSPLWDSLKLKTMILRDDKRHKISNITEKQKKFIDICDSLKYGSLESINWLNNNVSHKENEEGIYLCATNKDVDYYNKKYISKFKEVKEYIGKINGIISTPIPSKLNLKLAVGMEVMTLINTKRYKNGSMGIITKLNKNSIKVKFHKTGEEHLIKKYTFKYNQGTYTQFPIAVAKAITVNKSQGLTLEKANIVPGFFECGQLYTAITRVKDIKDISILGKLTENDLKVDTEALCQIA